MQAVERAVERVIEAIHENYGEEISIDDMARTAMYSKFHFTRIFQRVTGLTPGRFLSAVRLQKAKELLTSTSLSVTDISHMVGYTSIGTFSSRFGYSVCVPPSSYRQLGGFRPWSAFQNRGNNGDNRGDRRLATEAGATVRGNISVPDAPDGSLIFVGLFPSRIPQGEPIRCTILRRPGPYVLEDVPQGSWYVMACSSHGSGQVAVANGAGAANGYRGNGSFGGNGAANGHRGNGSSAAANGHGNGHRLLAGDQGMLVGANGPITVFPGMVQMADIRLRAMGTLDPPVLLALPDLRPETLEGRPEPEMLEADVHNAA
jgi:AraC-like DNA-binding protein